MESTPIKWEEAWTIIKDKTNNPSPVIKMDHRDSVNLKFLELLVEVWISYQSIQLINRFNSNSSNNMNKMLEPRKFAERETSLRLSIQHNKTFLETISMMLTVQITPQQNWKVKPFNIQTHRNSKVLKINNNYILEKCPVCNEKINTLIDIFKCKNNSKIEEIAQLINLEMKKLHSLFNNITE